MPGKTIRLHPLVCPAFNVDFDGDQMAVHLYKQKRGGTRTLGYISCPDGKMQRISTEYHHVFITQRLQRKYNLPNWLVNNRLNVWRLNTIQHSIMDKFRFNFLNKSLKPYVGLFKKYGWFTRVS